MAYSIPKWQSAFAALLIVAAALPARSALPDIYPAPDRSRAELAVALKAAHADKKRVILDFGGNWCPDCHALDIYFHDAANKPILDANFILVHINVGRIDANLDLADRYHVPVVNGVPALAVLDSNGKILHSQRTGEFKDMRHMQSSAVTDFLLRWKRSE